MTVVVEKNGSSALAVTFGHMKTAQTSDPLFFTYVRTVYLIKKISFLTFQSIKYFTQK